MDKTANAVFSLMGGAMDAPPFFGVNRWLKE
jgi:hypothetical protein